MAYVYKHTRLDKNEIFYIGISGDSNYSRAYTTSGRNLLWKRITKKTKVIVEIIADNLLWEEACSKEIELIKQYGRYKEGGTLVNLTEGGEGFSKPHTIESKKKISKALQNKSYKDIHGGSNAEAEKLKRKLGVKRYWDNASEDERKKRSLVHVGKGKPHINKEKPIECPHCGKSGRASLMVRWHFDKCSVYTGKKN